MSDDKDFDFKLPDLPSDEELGISPEDYDLLDEDGEVRKGPPPPKAEAQAPGASPEPAKKKRSLFGRKKKVEAPKAQKAPKAPKPTRAEKKAAKEQTRAAEKKAPAEKQAVGGSEDGTGDEATPAAAVSPRRGPVVLAALVVMAWASGSDRSLPMPVAANAPDTEFSSARAMSDLMEIAREPHAPGSPEHERVRGYIVDRLRTLGLEPEVQSATSVLRAGEYARAASIHNVVARLSGTESTGAVLITAHYDGREQALAAGDDGSGVVAILEAVRAVQAGPPLRNDLIVLITDAEEEGLFGARAFVDEHPWMEDVAVVLSVEMRGGGGPSIMFETGEQNGWIVRAYQSGASRPFANSTSYEVYKRLPNDTDFTPFKVAGKQGLNFAALGRAHVHHQRYDSPQNLSERTLQHHGVHALDMLRHLGNEDLASVEAPDVVFFRVLGLGLIVYGERWVIPFTMLLGVLAFSLFFVGRRRGIRGKGVAAGLLFGLLTAGAAAGAGWGWLRWVSDRHPEFGSLHGSAFHSEGWYVLALTAAAATVATLLLSLARRWFSTAELTLGALVLPFAGAVALTITMPMAAMNLQWPILAALLGVGLLVALGPGRDEGTVGTVLLVLLAAPVLMFLVPLIELLWLAMSFRLALALGVLISLTLLLLLPALDRLRPNWWFAPLVGALATAAFLGIGLMNSRPSADRPAPSTLLFAMDTESGVAQWVTDAADSTAPGDVWATAQVGEFSTDATLEAFLRRPGDFRVKTAQRVAAPAPEVGIVSDAVVDGRRVVQVGVRSVLGAEMMLLRFPERPALVAVGGKAVPSRDPGGEPLTGSARLLEHWGTPAEGTLLLDFEVGPMAAAIDLVVVEHHLRPWELLGSEPWRRPPDLAPDITQLSDRAMIRTVVRLELGAGAAMIGPEATGDQVAPVGLDEEMPAQEGGEGAAVDSTAAPSDSIATPPDTTTVPDSAGVKPDSVVADTIGGR